MTMHPNSLANLKPPWQPGVNPNPRGNPKPGPKVSPALHKYLQWTYEEIVELAASERANKLPMADVIAITAILKAAKDQMWGDKTREWVTDRTEGRLARADVDVAVDVGVVVQLRWANGDEVEL